MRNCCGTDTEDAGLENNHTGPWYLDDLYVDTTGVNLLNPIPSVPEPSALLLATVGCLGIFSLTRHRSSGIEM